VFEEVHFGTDGGPPLQANFRPAFPRDQTECIAKAGRICRHGSDIEGPPHVPIFRGGRWDINASLYERAVNAECSDMGKTLQLCSMSMVMM
jgi:hypothetical protein